LGDITEFQAGNSFFIVAIVGIVTNRTRYRQATIVCLEDRRLVLSATASASTASNYRVTCCALKIKRFSLLVLGEYPLIEAGLEVACNDPA
jgi:hypothetical protein